MEQTLSESEQQLRLISSFLEIAVGQNPETARWFLQATNWKLDEALFLFYSDNQNRQNLQNDYAVRETLRGPARTTNYRDEHSSLMWGQNQGTSSVLRDRLSSLYSPPFHLLFTGTFQEAKTTASRQDKWLLLNLQSAKEFSSHTLNRDTWSNDAVSQTIEANFVFLQVFDDTKEGRSVCTLYELESTPVVLVIDPITGQKMRFWCGMIDPETLLEDLVPFMDHGPREGFASSLSRKRPRRNSMSTPHSETEEDDVDDMNDEDKELHREVAASLDNMKIATLSENEKACSSNVIPAFPPLPEEPKGDCDRSVLCRVGVRLPDGRRLPRNFIKTDPIQLLWSFCYSQLQESERKPLKLTLAIPGASKTLVYESRLALEQSGLDNSLVSVTWG